jgi:FKBP-type peptidyl-prolyl cis-trans isomerase
MQMPKFIFFLAAFLFITACKKDDGDDVVRVPPRDLAEVAAENDADIREYLETHFYNYEEFQNPPDDFDYKIRIDTLAGENAGKKSLKEDIKTVKINVNSDEFGLSEDVTTDHTLYYLVAREGAGMNPTVGDSTLVRYEGMLLDGEKFDASESFLWQELPFTLRGYANGVSKLKSGTPDGLIVNNDGTFLYTDSGIGLIIMPSGLAYFNGNGASSRLPSYSNLIFQVEVGNVIVDTDNDNDGIPSILEDLNGNGYLFDDNTDRAEEEASRLLAPIANFRDADDDGDGTLTRDEINLDADGNLVLPFPDADNDGVPDHLDRDTP